MPRVPLYQTARVPAAALPAGGQGARIDRARRDGAPQGLNRLAAGLAEVGDSLAQRERRQIATVEEAEYLAAQSRADEMERQLLQEGDGESLAGERQEAGGLEAFQAGLREIAAGFSTPRLSRLWAETSASRVALLGESLARRRESASERRLDRARLRRMESHREGALAGLDDPQRFAARLELVAVDAGLHAEAQGLDGQARDDFVRGQLAALHEAVLGQYVAQGALDRAQDYLERHAGDYPAAALDGSRRRLAGEVRLEDGRRLGDALIVEARQSTGDGELAWYEPALAAAEGLGDPETKALARRRIEAVRRRASVPDPAVLAERERSEAEAIAFVEGGGNPDELDLAARETLGSEGMARLRQLFDRPQDRRSDWRLYAELSALPPPDLAALDLFGFRQHLAEPEFRFLRAEQLNARQVLSDESDADGVLALFDRQASRQALLESQGLEAHGEEPGRFAAHLDRGLRQARRAKGRQLDQGEEEAVLQRTLQSYETRRNKDG
ncbi:MAG: hypothetical protein Kilf2KO_47840 [Rhodospirillales bacterium]